MIDGELYTKKCILDNNIIRVLWVRKDEYPTMNIYDVDMY